MNMKKLFWKIFISFILILITTVLIINIFVFKEFRESYLKQIDADLTNSAYLVARFLDSTIKQDNLSQIQLDKICKNYGEIRDLRVTIINSSGLVLGDSYEDIKTMDNHINRPEVLQALRGVKGKAVRYSKTLNTNMMYIAVPCSHNKELQIIVRTAYPLSLIELSEKSFFSNLIIICIFAFITAAGFSYYIAFKISSPLIKIKKWAEDFTNEKNNEPIYVDGPYEVESLARTMNKMMTDINNHITIISDKEKELTTLMSSMTEGVIAVDSEKNILFINKMAKVMFSLTNQKYRGQLLLEIIRCSDLEQLILKTLKQKENVEVEFDVESDSIKVFKAKSALLKGTDDIISGVVVVISDITRIRKLENIRRDFVANVSHELRTPITSIKGYVETLIDGAMGDKENAGKFLHTILNQSNRLNSIINDLLTLSSIEQDEKKDSVIFDLNCINTVISSAISVCKLKASKKDIKIKIEGDKEANLTINSYLFEQAMINLIDNAIKYSFEKSEIKINIEKAGSYINIYVIDYGIGIAKEHISRLFERFYRVDKARSRNMGGTGLGLAIVKHIINIHKGTVFCISEAGKGTTFKIQLPV